MLRLDRSLEIAGLTLYRDDRVESTFHYLPAAPTLVDDPGPGIQLLRYRGAVSGGLLSVSAGLRVDPETLDVVRGTLRRRIGSEPELVPVSFDQGSARLVVLDADSGATPGGEEAPPRLVERVLGSSTPSLLADQRVIFSARLTPAATTLAEAALDGTGAPLLVCYELAFSGLRPSRGLRVEVDYAMAYDHLRTRLAVDTLWFRVDLDRETEALRRAGHLRVVDVAYEGSEPEVLAQRAAEVRRTLRELMETLFVRPAASPAALPPESLRRQERLRSRWQAAGAGRAAFVLRALRQREEQTLTYDYSVTKVARARVAPRGAVGTGGADPGRWLAEVRFDDPPSEIGVSAYTLEDADWMGVRAVTVDFRSGAEVRSVTLDPTTLRASAVLPSGQAELRLRALTDPDDADLGSPPEAADAFAPLTTENVFVEPHRVAGRRPLRLVVGGLHGVEVDRFAGRLSDGTRSRSILIEGTEPELSVGVWGAGGLTLDGTLHLEDGHTEVVLRSVGADESLVRLSPSLGDRRTIRAVFSDPLARYDHVDVEVEEVGATRRRSFVLSRERDGDSFEVDAGSALRYRSTGVLANARVVETGWREADAGILVFGDFRLRRAEVELILLPRPGLLAAQVALSPEPAPEETEGSTVGRAEALIEAGQRRTLELALGQDADLRYRVEGQLFVETGVEAIGPYESADEVLVLGSA